LSYGQEDGQGCFKATYSVPPFNEGGFFSITLPFVFSSVALAGGLYIWEFGYPAQGASGGGADALVESRCTSWVGARDRSIIHSRRDAGNNWVRIAGGIYRFADHTSARSCLDKHQARLEAFG